MPTEKPRFIMILDEPHRSQLEKIAQDRNLSWAKTVLELIAEESTRMDRRQMKTKTE